MAEEAMTVTAPDAMQAPQPAINCRRESVGFMLLPLWKRSAPPLDRAIGDRPISLASGIYATD
jgi:hypothetical protein